jgi:hypothetical protein
MDQIYSNDIYAILCAYGVEAARQAILREIAGVFSVYKIDVDMRHLELISDYMVRTLILPYLWGPCLLFASFVPFVPCALTSYSLLCADVSTETDV